MYDGKIITGWDRMKANDVRIRKGEITEEQIISIHLHDGTHEELELKDFNDTYILSPQVPVTEESTSGVGDHKITMFTVEIPTMNKRDHGIDIEEPILVEINSKFVN